MTTEAYTRVAVSIAELIQFGCPYCGFRSGSQSLSAGGAVVWSCGECGKECCGLSADLTKSPIGFGEINNPFYPELQDHPRRGIPSHGRLDKRPEEGGELFSSRGFGLDMTPGCFVCGGGDGIHNNIAAFVQCKEAGERVVAMFNQGARLDYREQEPDRVQVKIGVCEQHLPKLEKLHMLTLKKGTITQENIQAAQAA